MTTIYRKYRPQTFSDVIGQTHITKTIENEIIMSKTTHSYLFSGPRGVGKTTTARLLAKALNCTNRDEKKSEPCEECNSCIEITKGRNIDVIEIDAASHTGVDNVRENIIDNAKFKPTKSKYKVFIIDEVHMLSTSAFNALLKTLEEPPEYIVFILATTELHKLPVTIISRCERFNFQKITFDAMLERLNIILKQEKIKVENSVLKKIINKSDGCLRDAESLLGQILSLGQKEITENDASIILPTSNTDSVLKFIENIIRKDTKKSIELLESLINDGINLNQFTIDILEVLRIMMVSQIDTDKIFNLDYSKEAEEKIKKIAKEIDTQTLINLIEKTLIRKQEIKNSPVPQLPLEMLAIEFSVLNEKKTKNTDLPEKKEPKKVEIQEKKQFEENLEEELTKKSLIENNTEVTEQKKPVREAIKSTISKITKSYNIKTELTEIEKNWQDIKIEFTEKFSALGMILNMSSLKEVTNKGLILKVPFILHKEKLLEREPKLTMEKILEELFQEKIPFNCIVETKQNIENNANNLATEFGGEIV